MISFTIDSSVLAIPQEDNNIEAEFINLQCFLLNINNLYSLEKMSSITVSYMNGIKFSLLNIRERIQKLKENNKILNFNNPDILEYYHKTLKKILPRKHCVNKLGHERFQKGKIGIYENIPDRDSDPPQKRNISYNKSIYPVEYKKYLSTFEKYLVFIAELNIRFDSENVNYIALSGNKSLSKEVVSMCYDGTRQSRVNIIGIQKFNKLSQDEKYSSIEDALSEITKSHSENLIYGNKYKDNFNKYINNNTFISTRLFNYLKTLNEIVNIIKEKEIIDDNEVNKLVNAHGCLCSPDDEIYKNCRNLYRHFNNKNEYFTLHLKPTTETTNKVNTYTLGGEEYNSTIRIYFKKKNKKILIGWIGKHPTTCYDCNKKHICNNPPQKKH